MALVSGDPTQDMKSQCVSNNTVKHYFFRRILILRFPYVENLLHFNLAYFPVNFIKHFVSCFFWRLHQISLSKFLLYYCLHYILPRVIAYRIT